MHAQLGYIASLDKSIYYEYTFSKMVGTVGNKYSCW